MPILPRSAVASSDFRPYCSPSPATPAQTSNLNVILEPANPKASRPPLRTNSVIDNGNGSQVPNSASHGMMVTHTAGARGGSLKASSILTAAAKA